MSRLNIDINSPLGTDVCNRHFIDRNNRFWALLWPSLYTRPYFRLPFYSSFCLGSGKQRYINGVLCQPVRSWWKLNRQALQPSVPQQHIDYNFDDSFDGGCSLKILPGADLVPRRLFVVDWPIDDGLIVAYAFKAIVPVEDVSLWLKVQTSNGKILLFECGSDENTFSHQIEGHRRLFPLKATDLTTVMTYFEIENDKCLSVTARNGWFVRYYYVSIEASEAAARVTDIGVGTRHGMGVYLGAVQVHCGNSELNRRLISQI